MNIKFILTCAPADKIYISPAYFMLRTYFDLNSSNKDKVKWFSPFYDPNVSLSEIVKTIVEEEIDILCLSVFIWNRVQLLQLAESIKKILPNIIIVAGGPDLDAHRNPEFFKDYPYLDYVVYGDGEEAFTEIVNSIIEKRPLTSANNIVTAKEFFPHKIFQDEEFSKISPWLVLRDEIKETVDNFGKDNCILFWEMARGCPYKCSFCDWNNGLHNKVKRRRSNWKEEIDFFSEIGAEVRVIDANWGIYKEDVEIHKYAVDKLVFHAFNLPKLNKKIAYDIMSFSYQHFPNEKYRVSLQDVNEEVLKNIDRPSIPWDEHKQLLLELREKHPNISMGGEVIVGLPGQTVDSWIETLIEIESASINTLHANIWMLLPNSPAYKKEYQKKFEITNDELIFINKEFNSVDEVYNAIDNGLPGWYKTRIVTGMYTANFTDIITMSALSLVYVAVKEYFKKIPFHTFIKKIRKRLEEECQLIANDIITTKVFGVQKDGKIISFDSYFLDVYNIKQLLKS
jgi:putative methyltransferase